MINVNNLIENFLKFIIYLYPVSFIFGNLIINASTLLIFILGLLYFKKNLFLFNDKKIIIYISSFFFLIIFSTVLEILTHGYYADWTKSLFYLRFFFLLLVLKAIVYSGLLNLNLFLSICFLITCFVSADIIIQFMFGKNLLGFSPVLFSGGVKYYSGIFREELIAGGYILMFSIIGIFSLPHLLKNTKKTSLSIIFLLISVFFFISLLLAGNRMPTLMFIFFLILFSILVNKRKYKYHFFLIGFTVLFIGAMTILKSENIKNRYGSFFIGIPNPVHLISEIKKNYPELESYKDSKKPFHTFKEYNMEENYKQYPMYTGHFPLYLTSIDLFIDDPLVGKGIKSFRNNCINKVFLPNRVCESHPHNFTLEILNDTGILGLLLIFLTVVKLLINLYKDYLSGEKRNNLLSNWIYIAFILAVIINFFPLRSSGSFFSTFNSAYTFLIIGISMGLNELRFKKDK